MDVFGPQYVFIIYERECGETAEQGKGRKEGKEETQIITDGDEYVFSKLNGKLFTSLTLMLGKASPVFFFFYFFSCFVLFDFILESNVFG